MGNIIIGILFIIGGLSGHFVMRGTNSPGALIVVGVILCIWGFVQLGRKSESDDSEPAVTIAKGDKRPLSSLNNPSKALKFKAYDKDSQRYLGTIIKVNQSEKTVAVKTDFGTTVNKTFDELEILDENRTFAVPDQAGTMAVQGEMLPELYKCPSCGVELELEEMERVNRYFTCPGCHRSFDFSKS